jgi:predicted Zn-dependent protease
VLARLQHQLPRLLGGGVTEACANFERAVRIAPENTVTRIYFAQLLLGLGEKTRARSELEHVLNAPYDHDWAFEINRDQRLAKKMLAGC